MVAPSPGYFHSAGVMCGSMCAMSRVTRIKSNCIAHSKIDNGARHKCQKAPTKTDSPSTRKPTSDKAGKQVISKTKC